MTEQLIGVQEHVVATLVSLHGSDWALLPDLEGKARAAGIAGDDLIGLLEHTADLARAGQDQSAPDEVMIDWDAIGRGGEQPAAAPDPVRVFSLTDLGNAERLVVAHGGEIRYVPELGWHAWDTRRWRLDGDGEVMRRMKLTVRGMLGEAAAIDDGDARKKLVGWEKRSESRAGLAAAISLAESDSEIVARLADLDSDPWLLNVPNGMLHLETGALVPHRPELLQTKLAPVPYEPGAAAPTWLRFLDTIFAGNTDLIEFVQRAVGYSLTGSTAEQVLFLLHGRGANGKTTLVETIRAMLGDYAQQAPAEMLMRRDRRGGPSPELARLPGARFVATVETGEGGRLDEALVKQLTGGDTITTRPLYRGLFEFQPTHKLWLATNHLPNITGTDEAIWRRVRLIPFTVTIPEQQRDATLPDQLRRELPGILTWAVDGCARYRRHGLAAPDAVTTATAAYRSDMDAVGSFLDDNCVEDAGASVKASIVFDAYTSWSRAAGDTHTLTGTAFGRRLTERGYQKDRRRDGIWYTGLGLLLESGKL